MTRNGTFAVPDGTQLLHLLRQMAITECSHLRWFSSLLPVEIDLSVGALLGLLGGVAVFDVIHGWPLRATISTVLVLGVALGAFNGWLTAYLGIPSFNRHAWRPTSAMASCSALWVKCHHCADLSSEFKYIGQGYLPAGLAPCAIALFERADPDDVAYAGQQAQA